MKRTIDELVRRELRELEPYVCARDLFKKAEIFLDANENAFGSTVEPVFGVELNRYPDSDLIELRQELAKYVGEGVKPDNILIGNGSDEIIDLCMRCFCERGENIITLYPDFSMYKVFGKINGLEVRQIQLNEDFQLNVEKILSACDSKTKMIYLSCPNSPLGNAADEKRIVELLEKANCLVFVDEAYFEFYGFSMAGLVKKYPNLLVSRTLSKAWGLAGIRVGYLIADEKAVGYLRRMKAPYNVGALEAEIALSAIRNGREKMRKMTMDGVFKQKEILEKELQKLRFFVFPSVTNFLLVKAPSWTDAKKICSKLAEKGIILRDFSSKLRLENCIRITVGNEKENKRLLEEIGKAAKMKTDCVLFDMDGVLVDVRKSYRESIRRTASEYLGKDVRMSDVSKIKSQSGFNNDWDAAYALVGCLKTGKVRMLTQKDRKSKLYSKLKASFQKLYLGELILKETPLLQKETLKRLVSSGIKVGIVTGRPKEEAMFAIRNNGWEGFFNADNIVALEDCEKKKPSPEPLILAAKKLGARRPVYVGDSPSDAEACRAAGIPCIFVGREKIGDVGIEKTDDVLEVLL